MRKFLLFVVFAIGAGGTLNAQLPIAYYDFELNSARNTTFENSPEQSINTSLNLSYTASAGTFNSYTGAGVYNGNIGSNFGIARGGNRFGVTSPTDPVLTPMLSYFSIPISSAGFSNLSISFDFFERSGNSAYFGIKYSIDGGANFTWLGSQPNSAGFPAFSATTWQFARIPLPAACDNQAGLVIAIYGYERVGTMNTDFFFDNFTLNAASTVAGKVFTSLDELAIATSTTSGLTGIIFGRNNFDCTGLGTTMTMGSQIAINPGGTLSVSSAATLNTGNGTIFNFIFGTGAFTLNSGTTLIISDINGISNTATTGNIFNTLTRTFSPAANYTYTHPLGTAQNTGTALPTNITGNLTINNTNPVTLTQNTSLSNPSTLFLTQGAFTNGTRLTLNTGTTINRDAGSLVSAPTFNPTIDLVYSGTTAVTSGFEVPAARNILNNVTLNKSALANTVTLADTLFLNNTFFPTRGTLNLGNTGTFVFQSNTANTANLANFDASTAAFTYTGAGGFSIERYLPSQVAWRLLAAPIQTTGSQTVFQAYQENTTATISTGFGTQITGIGAGNGFDLQTPSYSMKSFNSASQNYSPVTNTNTTAIANPAGYYVFVRGDKSIAPGGGGFTTLRMKGRVFTGTQVVNVPAAGFASFGNPYPSRIDMRTTLKSVSLVDGFTVWNPGTPGLFNVGGYEAYTLQGSPGQYRNSAGTVIRNFIESGEAVFLQTPLLAPAGTLTINESDKAAGSSIVSRESNSLGNDARFVLALSRLDASNIPTYKSAVLINPDAAYSNDLDNNDVRKFNNSSDNLSMTVAGANLEVNRRNVFTATDTIFLKLTSTATANYMFDAFAENIVAPGLTAYLQDKFTNTTTILSLSDSTHIPFSISAAAGSNAADRFSIVFKQAEVLPISFTSITAVRNADKTATVNWAVATETGVAKYDIEHSTDGTTFIKIGEQSASNAGLNASYNFIHTSPSATENFYRIRSKENAGNSKLSNVAKIAAMQEFNNVLLSVFPNPVSNGVMNVSLSSTAGIYSIALYDNSGKRVLQKSGLVSTARNTINVEGLSAGIYTLEAIFGKEKQTIKVSIL